MAEAFTQDSFENAWEDERRRHYPESTCGKDGMQAAADLKDTEGKGEPDLGDAKPNRRRIGYSPTVREI